MEREGFLIAGTRVYHRIWQLYAANIVLFVMLMAIVSYTADLLKTSRYIDWFEGTSFFYRSQALRWPKVLLLQFQIAFLDILPLYIACLGFLPLVLAGFRFRLRTVISRVVVVVGRGPVRWLVCTARVAWLEFQPVRTASVILSRRLARLAKQSY
jgi:hypothetical protein